MTTEDAITRRGVLRVTGGVAVAFAPVDPGRAAPAAAGRVPGVGAYSAVAAANTALFPDGASLAAAVGGMRQVQADIAVLYRGLPVAADSFGAAGDGVADDAPAINAALATGRSVVLGDRVYAIGSTIRLTADGQSLIGRGAGNRLEPARSHLKWIGPKRGTMLAVSNGTSDHWQDCVVAGLYLDGNARAAKAIEGYTPAIRGGCWRNRYDVSIANLAAPSIGIDLGSGAFPDFAHDTILGACFIADATVGVVGKGSKHKLYGTIFSNCGTAIAALTGSDWAAFGAVYSQNGWDVDMGAGAGFNDFGSWHEDSRNGLVRCATSMTLTMTGGYYHTGNPKHLIDLGQAQGYFVINGQVGPGSKSFKVVNLNPNTEYSAVGSNVVVDGGYRQVAQGATRAAPTAFAAGLARDHAAGTGDGTRVALKLAFIEQYDSAAAFAAETGIFTAPLAGYYQFTGAVSLADLAAAHNDARLDLVAGGQTHLLARLNPGAARIAGNELLLEGTRTISLRAGETAYLQLVVAGGARTVGIVSGGPATNWRTLFAGKLA